jgi:hypothetical protein
VGGHPEYERAAAVDRVGQRGGREGAEVTKRATPPQRAEHAEHEAVHVEQRQGVDERVGGRPRPGVGERVEVRGDRATREHRTFGRAGRAGGVDHQSGVGRRCGFGVSHTGTGGLARTRRVARGDVAELRQRGGEHDVGSGQYGLRRGVGDDVRELAGAAARVDRDGRDAREQRRDDPDRGGQRRRRPDRDPVQPGDLLREGTRPGGQLGVGQRTVREGERRAVSGRREQDREQRVAHHATTADGASLIRPPCPG